MSNNPRAVKYRRLALVEPDEGTQLLRLLAEEAEKGILVTSDLHRAVTQQALPMKISPE
jgi:hypothetical protein